MFKKPEDLTRDCERENILGEKRENEPPEWRGEKEEERGGSRKNQRCRRGGVLPDALMFSEGLRAKGLGRIGCGSAPEANRSYPSGN